MGLWQTRQKSTATRTKIEMDTSAGYSTKGGKPRNHPFAKMADVEDLLAIVIACQSFKVTTGCSTAQHILIESLLAKRRVREQATVIVSEVWRIRRSLQ